MKFTKSWLEEHTSINTSIEELCEDLTMAGLEVDEITPLKNDFLIEASSIFESVSLASDGKIYDI